MSPCHGKTVIHIGRNLLLQEGSEVIPYRDSLIELPQLWLNQQSSEFRLSDENNLEKFSLVCFKVC